MLAFWNNIAGLDGLVILIIALLIFGKRLPEVMRSLGKGISEFKKGMNEMDAPQQQPQGYPQQGYQPQPVAQQKPVETVAPDLSAPPPAPGPVTEQVKDLPPKTL
ncbi:MAG TPA: twin-arginine translocase TatA/TatE family subunit [Planctomycetota bacterium]|nr:twin-arginine translocase TatA/TatE family subunit [Planctomycetota bacterium]